MRFFVTVAVPAVLRAPVEILICRHACLATLLGPVLVAGVDPACDRVVGAGVSFGPTVRNVRAQVLSLQRPVAKCLPVSCESEGAAAGPPNQVAVVDQFAVNRGNSFLVTLVGMRSGVVAGRREVHMQ